MITTETIAGSGYEGWVAWIDEGGSVPVPVFEAIPKINSLSPLIKGAKELPIRPVERGIQLWESLDQTKIQRLDLYFYPTVYEQPAWRVDREPGFEHMRFIQMKMGGIRVNAFEGDPREAGDQVDAATARTGIYGYRMGYWDLKRGISELWEITLMHRKCLGVRGHPCNPRPQINETSDLKKHGWALAPHVVGLTQQEIDKMLINN